VKVVRNVAIIAVIALVLTVLPSGGNLATGVLAALSLAFLGAMALLAVRFWRENSLMRDAMTERQRAIVYGALGAIALAVAGTDELLATGVGTVAWLVILGVSGWLIFNTVREANSI
jgi:hypothetical protein